MTCEPVGTVPVRTDREPCRARFHARRRVAPDGTVTFVVVDDDERAWVVALPTYARARALAAKLDDHARHYVRVVDRHRAGTHPGADADARCRAAARPAAHDARTRDDGVVPRSNCGHPGCQRCQDRPDGRGGGLDALARDLLDRASLDALRELHEVSAGGDR